MNRHQKLNSLLNAVRTRNGFIQNRLSLGEVPTEVQVDEIEASAEVILQSIREYKDLIK